MKTIPSKFKFLFINFMIAIAIVVCICTYVLHWLKGYTEHGHFIVVPNLETMTIEEADTAASQANLRILVIDSIYNENEAPGVIVEQYPISGTRVKKHRLIHLTINAHSPEKIAIPNLRNAAYRQTLQTLESRGFKIGQIEYATSEFKNLVLQLKYNGTELKPDTMLRKGSVIDIVLGNGGETHLLDMPQLLGKTLREAINLIRKSYLNIGKIIEDGSITSQHNSMEATIYQQSPEFDLSIEAATPVDLYITFDKEKIAALDTLLVAEPLP